MPKELPKGLYSDKLELQEQQAKNEHNRVGNLSSKGLLSWEQITPEQFPALTHLNPVNIYSLKLSLIKEEFESLMETSFLVQIDDDAVELVNGRVDQLRKEATKTVFEMFPNVEPKSLNQDGIIEFTRDDAALLAFVHESNAYQLYDPEFIPTLKNTEPDQILLVQLQILERSYYQWEELKKSDLTKSKLEEMGLLQNKDSSVNMVDRVAEYAQLKILTEMVLLSKKFIESKGSTEESSA